MLSNSTISRANSSVQEIKVDQAMIAQVKNSISRFVFVVFIASLLHACGGGTDTISAQAQPNTNNPGAGNPGTGTPPGSGSPVYSPSIAINNLNPGDYQIDAMQVGKAAYFDRTVTFTTIPQRYAGLDYIRTSNDDKTSTGNSFISFGVNINVTVYVAYDSRITTIPNWLTGWISTSETIATDDTTLNIYKKDFPSGIVALGGNQGTTGSSMYVVFVATQESANNGNGSGTALVSWTIPTARSDNTVLTNLAGFKIYYGTVSGSYSNVITINNSALSSHLIEQLTPSRYYFSVTAFDSNGMESGFSNEVSKLIQ